MKPKTSAVFVSAALLYSLTMPLQADETPVTATPTPAAQQETATATAAPAAQQEISATAAPATDQGTSAASTTSESNPAQSDIEAAYAAASAAATQGPSDIVIAGQATLKLPEGYAFVPTAAANSWLQAMGNSPSDSLSGIIYPIGDGDWFIAVSYQDAGYIKDDDAKNWNADELLSNLREGTTDDNKERKRRGLPEMEVVGWIERPQYNESTRQLIWSLESHDIGQAANEINGINYNTLALGREGYISMNLVTDVEAVEALKPISKSLLAALVFNEGKRYTDFNASTDKMAEYGLAALVAGVAAKKLGMLALLAAFAIKFGKIAIIFLLGGGAFLTKLFKRKKTTDTDTSKDKDTNTEK